LINLKKPHFFLILIILTSCYQVNLINASATVLKIVPEVTQAESIDEIIELDIIVENIPECPPLLGDRKDPCDLHSWSINVEYDDNILKFIEATEGNFLNQIGETYFSTITSGSGCPSCRKDIAMTSIQIIREGVSGSGVLVSMKFQIKKHTISTPVNFSSVESPLLFGVAQNGTYPLIPHKVQGATISLIEPGFVIAHAGSDFSVNEGMPAEFNGERTLGDDVSYAWTFNDGGEKTLSGKVTSYVFNTPGDYKVTLTASNMGNESTDTVVVRVLDITPPVPVISVEGLDENNQAYVDDVLVFDASESYDPEKSRLPVFIKSYLWSFGDGTISNEIESTHKYSENGEYTVRLEIIDDFNNTATEEYNIIITTKTNYLFYLILAIVVIVPIIILVRRNTRVL
jgi:hypothetical protein